MQDLQATIQQLLDFLKGIWIKKRYIIISTWLICPIGFMFVANMPDQYRSYTKIYVDTRSMLKPLLRGLTFQTNPQAEIKLIANTLLSTPNVEDLARKADLDLSANTDAEFKEVVSDLRKKIRVSGGGRNGIYNISVNDTDPQLAKLIVTLTMDKFVESALGQNRADSDTASQFLDQQIDEYAARLTAAENRVAEFKKQYGEILSGNSYYQQRANLRSQIEGIELELQEKKTQLISLREKFSSNEPTDSSSGNVNIKTQYDGRMSALQAKLDDLQIRFTEQHPDVIQTKEQLERLEKLKEEEIKELVKGLSSGEIATGGLSENAIVQELTILINRIDSEVASLEVRRLNFLERLADLDEKIELIPDIEAKRTALNRDYGITKRRYEEFLSRRESADLSRKADLTAEDVKFRVIEPPRVPLKPSGPNRITYYVMVLMAGFGAGVAVAFLTSQLNPVVLNMGHLTSLTDRPVLGGVTNINLLDIKKVERRKMIVFGISTSLVLLIFVSFVATELLFNTTPLRILENII